MHGNGINNVNNSDTIKNHVYLAQPQYAVDVGNEQNYWIPYSAGCIWSFCTQFEDIQEQYILADFIYKRDLHNNIIAKMQFPSVVGFSCYQWNKNYNLTLAARIKDVWPNCTIVFGGPEVTTKFLDNSFVDSIILAEGEHSFLDILRKKASNEAIPRLYEKHRLEDLSYPSPYTTGIFDKMIADNPGIKWALTLETNRGCPFGCTFCDWGSLTYSKIRKFPMERISADIDWISKNPISFIYCSDANFGIFKERDIEISKIIKQCAMQNPSVELFNATFNKNATEDIFKILNILGELNRGFSVSVQSLNDSTLIAINRANLEINDLQNIFRLCQIHNVNSYSEIILGLPCETKQSFINGLCKLLDLGQHNQIDIWFANMLVNSDLATLNSRLSYGIKTVETAKNFALLANDNDPWDETVDIVCSTNTMSTNDMIESFLFGWIIINFHLQGYSQLASKYCKYKHDINYSTFYNMLLARIQNNTKLNTIYQYAKKNITSFLYHGELDSGLSGHNLIYIGGLLIYQSKLEVLTEVNYILDQLMPDATQIKTFQKEFIFDKEQQYPLTVTCDYDLDSNTIISTTYKIDKKVNDQDLENFNNSFYRLRRKGLIKNRIQKV